MKTYFLCVNDSNSDNQLKKGRLYGAIETFGWLVERFKPLQDSKLMRILYDIS